jgi:S-adenosylmethionine synthetase
MIQVIPRISLLTSPAVHSLPIEIVEHKGIGHPDTICDALAENFSRGLCRFYVERFGEILHHNVDKALLCGGAAAPTFGGGKLREPIEIHLAGRAVCELAGTRVPVEEIAVEGSRAWIREHLPDVDPREHVRIVSHVRPVSPDLASLFRAGRDARTPLANDTSFGVGYAPLDSLETAVLAMASRLNSRETRSAHPSIGADIKIMGARCQSDVEVTVACALIGRHVTDLGDYAAKKEVIRALAIEAARTVTDLPLRVAVNAADGDSLDSVYLTVTGLSAEGGDDGQVGRGNRVNGLIAPYRPMSLEAAAGKNPVTHVGKLYGVMAHRVAAAVVAGVPEVQEAYCYLLSRIGRPITNAWLFELKVRLAEPELLAALEPRIGEIARATFADIGSLWHEAMAGTLRLY